MAEGGAVQKSKKAKKSETPLGRLRGALQDLPRVDEIPTSNGISTHLQILRAKDEIEELNEIKLAIEIRVRRMHTKVDNLFSSFSPLLSLGENLLSIIMYYLDEEALLAASEASYILNKKVISRGHWRSLQEKRVVGLLSLEGLGARDRGVAFARAARFARHMEQLAVEHYDYDYPAADVRSIKCQGCEDFPSVLHASPLDRNEFRSRFFVRFSFRNSRSLIWEGFVPKNANNASCIQLGLDDLLDRVAWPEVDSIRQQMRENNQDRYLDALQLQVKRCFENLLITVVAYDTWSTDKVDLVIATGGCSGEPPLGE